MEMNLETEQAIGSRRFQGILKGLSNAKHDQVLLDQDEWVVVPTLGAIVRGWVLAVPRQHVLSFRDWAQVGGQSAHSILAKIQLELGIQPDELIWFEHGSSKEDTLVGCGLDHAHLHILIKPVFSFDAFVHLAVSSFTGTWCATPATESYSAIKDTKASYFVAGSGDRAISAIGVESAGSQYFRRIVAALIDAPSEWDYRRYAHVQNVEETILAYTRHKEAARRGR